MTREEGERWIVDLVRDARLDAKIDLKQVSNLGFLPHEFAFESLTRPVRVFFSSSFFQNIVQMNHADTPVYQSVIEKSRGLLFRSQAIASAIEIRAGTQFSRAFFFSFPRRLRAC